jgi:acetolactate synthase-1/2/3 large subunit
MELLDAADVVLAVGLRAGTEITTCLTEGTSARIVHIGFDDRAENGIWAEAALSALTDCRLFLEQLAAATQTQGPRDGTAIRQYLAEYRRVVQHGLQSILDEFRNHRPVHFGLAVAELARRLRDDAIVVGGVGNHNVWGRRLLPVHHPFSHLQEGIWGGMGNELPGAIAAKLVFPERQVVALTGDGSFLMSCSDFGTAVECGANIILLILNDSRYGMIEQMQRRRFGRTYGAGLHAPDFARFAESFGAAGVRIENPHDIPEALDQAMIAAEETPVIVDVVSDPRYPLPSLKAIVDINREENR